MIPRVSGFKKEVSDLISTDVVPHTDLSGHHCRPAGMLLPSNQQEVVRIIKAAGRHGAKLHVVSCGRNWGFGSILPAKNGTWIVNLSRLSSISAYDADTGSIRIGPGVTQIMLYQELERLGGDWFFNVTGAGNSTSVLGNALERGIGYHGQRHLDLIDLEVVTGRGEVINTRLGADLNSAATLGADLTALFAQTALGMVISARLRLIPRTDGGGASIVRLKDGGRADAFFRAILKLKQEGAIAGVPHIANRARIVTSLAPWLPAEEVPVLAKQAAPWTAALPVTGCRELTEAAFSLIRKRLEDFCDVESVLASRLSIGCKNNSSPMEQLQQLASGYPSNLALPSVQWTALGTSDCSRPNPERTGAGLIHVTPSVRSSAEEIQRALAIIETCAKRLGFENLPVTVNIVSQSITVLVISVCFPAKEAQNYQHIAGLLQESLRTRGIMPYRIGIGQDDWVPIASKGACAVYRRLKDTFDPLKVFSNSKYEAAHLRTTPFVGNTGIQCLGQGPATEDHYMAEAA